MKLRVFTLPEEILYPMIVPEFYAKYVDQLEDKNVLEALKASGKRLETLIHEIREDQGEFAYEEGKWSIKDVVQHLNDTERILSMRAIAFARGDKTQLPGFEHEDYVKSARANKRSFFALMEEFRAVRQSSITLFKGLDPIQMQERGHANGLEFTVEAMGLIISGHTVHHANILEERYLPLL